MSSLTRQLGAHAERVRIVVVDASKNARNESLGRSAAASVRDHTGHAIAFIGHKEKAAIRQTLGASCDASLLDFAFRPGASGNRNVILLLSSGENVLFIDDDIVCDVWRLRSFGPPRIALGGHVEQREIRFYTRREDVRERLVPARVDLLNAHHAVLGRSIRSLASSNRGVDKRSACGHLLAAARGARRAVVRMTLSGIAGDTGATYPDRLLFCTGKWKAVLTGSRDSFETAFKSREVCKVANNYVVMHEIAWMTGCMGLTNTSITPPFLPVGRNEDGLFGATLSAIDPQTLGCHIPYAVVHDSPRPPRYPAGRFPSAAETRSADVLIRLIHSWAGRIRATDPRRRLIMLGKRLQNLAALRPTDFVRVTSLATLKTRERELSVIESALADRDSYPSYWQRDLRLYRKILLKHVTKPSFLLPLEFHGARTVSAGYDEFRQFVHSAGELYVEWPAVWMKARTKLRPFAED